MKALEDVHFVRALLDTAELNAVHTARTAGCSWAQIAVALHLSKQSAWEKWHELEVDPPTVLASSPTKPS